MRLGIFGGTFDPVHHAHLILVEYVRLDARLDRIILIPSAVSPHKQEEPVSGVADRLAMLREAVGTNQHLEVSDMEVKRGGVSYTVDTVRQLAQEHPQDELFLIIGSDNFEEFHSWKDPDEILRMAKIIALKRPGYEKNPQESSLLKGSFVSDVPGIEISSTQIRQRVAEGLPVGLMVPESVERYIKEHGLYKKKKP